MSNVQVSLTRGFRRADPETVNGHPIRGDIKETLRREHLLRSDVTPENERIATIRDTVISLMGAVSALIPLVIAFQSVIGA
jgi:hypothetical protein